MRRDEIVESIYEGTFKAKEKYSKWSGGLWLGVESLMVNEIANELHSRQKKSETLRLESGFKEIKELAGAKGLGRPLNSIKGSKRADIVLFNAAKRPVCVIEGKLMKDKWKNNALKDLDRIKGLVKTFGHKKGGTLRRGFLAVFFSKQIKGAHKHKSIEEIIEQNLTRVIGDNSESPEISMFYQHSDIYLEGKMGWVCICIEVALKTKK